MVYPFNAASARKRNEIPINATTWINIVNVMLSERSQPQKTTYFVIPLCEVPRRGESIETRKEVSGCLRLLW